MKSLNKLEEILLAPILGAMTVLVFVQVIFRFVLKASLPWSEELLRFLFIWSIMLGASVGIKRNSHLGLYMFIDMLPEKLKKYANLLKFAVIGVLCVLMINASYGLVMMQMNSNQLSAAMKVPMYYGTLAIPVGFGLIFIRIVQAMINEIRKRKWEVS